MLMTQALHLLRMQLLKGLSSPCVAPIEQNLHSVGNEERFLEALNLAILQSRYLDLGISLRSTALLHNL